MVLHSCITEDSRTELNFEVSGFHAMNLEDDPSVKEVSVEKTGFRVLYGDRPRKYAGKLCTPTRRSRSRR